MRHNNIKEGKCNTECTSMGKKVLIKVEKIAGGWENSHDAIIEPLFNFA